MGTLVANSSLIAARMGWHSVPLLLILPPGLGHGAKASRAARRVFQLFRTGNGGCAQHTGCGIHPICSPQAQESSVPILGTHPACCAFWGVPCLISFPLSLLFPLSVVSCCNDFKLKEGWLRLDIRNKYLTLRVVS